MINALRAEFKKILTVRSTYAITIFFLLLLGIIAFYGEGYKADPQALHADYLASTIAAVASVASIAGSLIGLFLMAHEYRYNTIVYTLTASNSRTKVLAAKVLAVLSFVLVYSILVTAIHLALVVLGTKAAGLSLPHQNINYLTFFAKSVFVCEAYAMVGLLVATLIRNMQAAVAVLFIVPNTLEQLLSIVIKRPDKWLPFNSLAQVIAPPAKGPGQNAVSVMHGAVVFLIYLLIGWLITWYLFVRRDVT